MLTLGKYSIGIGDRFGHQGKAQLTALAQARAAGVDVTPVWNKSFREHSLIGTSPTDTRQAADAAVAASNWPAAYFLDADHIGLKNVDGFITSCDFYTIDVADNIGLAPDPAATARFMSAMQQYIGPLDIPGLDGEVMLTAVELQQIGEKYLNAVSEAGNIYRHIAEKKGAENFVTEVSFDEANLPQSPVELFGILAALALEGVPAQTIAPKFTGRFNKGVDYVGNIAQFTREFTADLAVIQFAIKEFALPTSLKLSVHSGSDKFSIYRPIHQALVKFDAGLHLKTAGTSWLEEVIGLALAGGEGLAIVKDIYRQSLERYDELAKPYAPVIDIDKSQLPSLAKVEAWDGDTFAAALRHDLSNANYNLHFRQLLHVSFRIAAEMGPRYLSALEANEEIIARQVADNLYLRHICPVFLGK
ncbi:MAG: tagaturonate epimerase family protein [bacterium]